MEKEFIPYEQALALKELGFDESCFGKYYQQDGGEGFIQIGESEIEEAENAGNDVTFECDAPLYQQAFRWFREKYNILLDIVAYYDEEQLPLSKTNLQKPKGYFIWDFYEENFSVDKAIKFKDHEEAELECLKKLIEIVKEK